MISRLVSNMTCEIYYFFQCDGNIFGPYLETMGSALPNGAGDGAERLILSEVMSRAVEY